jgi:hypothetical protein
MNRSICWMLVLRFMEGEVRRVGDGIDHRRRAEPRGAGGGCVPV